MSVTFDQHLGKTFIMTLEGCGDVDFFIKVMYIMTFIWRREHTSELSLLTYYLSYQP